MVLVVREFIRTCDMLIRDSLNTYTRDQGPEDLLGILQNFTLFNALCTCTTYCTCAIMSIIVI